MPRVVLVVPSFPRLSETFIVSKFVGLLQRGWDVHIVCGNTNPAEWKHFPELDKSEMQRRVHTALRVHPRWRAALAAPPRVAWTFLHKPQVALKYLSAGRRLLGHSVARNLVLDAELILLRPDIVHFEFGALAPGRMHVKDLLDCRVTVSFRGYDINFSGLEDPGFYDPVWKRADALHFLGMDLRRRALRRGCPENLPYELIPPAIDADFFSPGSTRDEVPFAVDRPVRLLSVGRLTWKKGYEFALQAVRHVLDEGIDCEYTIVGGGEYLEAIAFARYQLGLENVVQLVGPQSREKVKEYMERADIFLHAAVSEGFCNAVIEAQAMQIPVVCTDADGLRENVEDEMTGFVVPRRDPRALADKLVLLAKDSDLRRRMGESGRRRVIERFSIADQIETFDRFYRQVLSS